MNYGLLTFYLQGSMSNAAIDKCFNNLLRSTMNLSRFVDIELSVQTDSDATTILKFPEHEKEEI